MGMLVWVMMGLAIWHFTVFLPDRYWGGIVGAFFGAVSARSSRPGRSTASRSRPERHGPRDGPGGHPGRADRHRAVYFEGVRRGYALDL